MKKSLEKLLKSRIDILGFTGKIRGILDCANIAYVARLCDKTEREMLKYRNVGRKMVEEIKEKLASVGLSLGMKIPQRIHNSLEFDYLSTPENQEELLGRGVEILGLSAKTDKVVCLYLGITSVRRLCMTTEESLRAGRTYSDGNISVSPTALVEIKRKLKAAGLSLGMTFE